MSYTKRNYYQVKPTLKVKENIKIPRTYFDIFAKNQTPSIKKKVKYLKMRVVHICWILFLTLSVSEKLKNSNFENPIIPETLNIKNLRTTSI